MLSETRPEHPHPKPFHLCHLNSGPLDRRSQAGGFAGWGGRWGLGGWMLRRTSGGRWFWLGSEPQEVCGAESIKA